jgi:CheY-like chemotaxis protein
MTATPLTILLVDDSPSVLAVYGHALEQVGFQVLKASRSDEALELAKQHAGRIDLLATDLVLTDQLRLAKNRSQRPSLHGLILMRKLVGQHPHMKVLVFSGQADDLVQSLGGVPKDIPYLRKPASPEALVRKIRQLLEMADTPVVSVLHTHHAPTSLHKTVSGHTDQAPRNPMPRVVTLVSLAVLLGLLLAAAAFMWW